mmetsp:Transcript_46980/g.110646  ORF Transcript_46980/g.110646 Transcript_46980/m.110646 type:complete len:269 (-) Transcript_46980:135-941(-)
MTDSNELLPEEREWVHALDIAAREAGLTAPNKYWLCMFAIQAKGDVKKALKRIANWQKIEEEYKLSQVSSEAASNWARATFPNIMFCVGKNKEHQHCMGMRPSWFDPKKLKTEEDWRLYLKNIALNLQSMSPTLSHVRRGMCSIVDQKGAGWANFDRAVEKRKSLLYQDAFPIKVKQAFVVNPPFLVSMLFKIAKLFVSAKILRRVVFVSAEELMQRFGMALLPPELGGTNTDDFFEWRELYVQQFDRSVLEVEGSLTRLHEAKSDHA